jgi:hypothetical protein
MSIPFQQYLPHRALPSWHRACPSRNMPSGLTFVI